MLKGKQPALDEPARKGRAGTPTADEDAARALRFAGETSGESLDAAVDRLAASGTFAKAQRSVQLLRHLLQMRQDGREAEIKEYTLAAEVFGRESYDPKIDSTVRVEASRLRSLLAKYYEGEGAGDPVRLSIPKGGYQLVVEAVEKEESGHAAPSGQSRASAARWRWLALATAVLAIVAVVTVRSWPQRVAPRPQRVALAILPFELLSARPSFADGLVDDIAADLAAGGGLDLASRQSAFAYRAKSVDSRQIGRELGVQALLTGSVREEPGQVRATVQFTDARTGFAIATQSFVKPLDDPLRAQAELARQIAHLVRHEMVATRRALLSVPPGNEEAWNRYLRATRMTETDPSGAEAIDLYDSAASADPNFAAAWAASAHTAVRLYEWGLLPKDRLPAAERSADRAMSLDSRSVEALTVKGRLRVLREFDWRGAERSLRRAMALDASQPDAPFYLARLVLVPQGRFDEAIVLLHRATSLDPTRYDVFVELAAAHIRAGKMQEAERVFDRRRTDPAPALAVWRGIAAASEGRFGDALDPLRDAARRNPARWTKAHLAFALAKLGHVEAARRLVDELIGFSGSELDRAAVLDALGERDRALELLEQAVGNASPTAIWLQVDYRFRDLNQVERFRSLIRRMGLPG